MTEQHLIESESKETLINILCQRKKGTLALMILEFTLKIAIWALGTKIFESHAANTSVGHFNSEWRRRLDFDLLGIFNIMFSLGFTWLKYPFVGEIVFLNDFICACFATLDIFAELTVYRELACFNQDSGSIVATRSILVGLYVITVYANLILSCYTLLKLNAKYLRLHLTFCVLIAAAIGSMLVLNLQVLARETPLAYGQISPRHIHMAFFNQTEIRQIQDGAYKRDSTFESRLVGRLSDVVESQNIMPIRCGQLRETWLIYTFEIQCTPENRLLYADCDTNTTSLTIGIRYLEQGFSKDVKYPSYLCKINLNEESLCRTKCEQLYASKYELILIQLREGRVEPAWTGLNSCNPHPSVRLIRDDAISPCLYF